MAWGIRARRWRSNGTAREQRIENSLRTERGHSYLRDASGFTLIELLVTLFIIVTLTGVVLPVAGDAVTKIADRSLVQEMEADVVYAQKRAVATERTVQLDIPARGRTYKIVEQQGSGSRELKAVSVPERLAITEGVVLTFHPDQSFPGHANGGTVSIQRNGVAFAELIITPISVRTRVVWHE